MVTKQQRQEALACLGLAVGTLLLYWPAGSCGFISLDDTAYVVNNFHINGGLNWGAFLWSFQAGHAGNWHPLTWLSHALDCQIFGVRPGPQHLMNVAIHAANSVLLFLILRRMTGTFWRSLVVGALFAWHPLHVESVAWIAERKDVLSTLFWMLTVWAYLGYVACRRRREEALNSPKTKAESESPHVVSYLCGAGARYLLVLAFFALGLMAKPMVVTLPFVLLLLDWWPLNRFGLNFHHEGHEGHEGKEAKEVFRPSCSSCPSWWKNGICLFVEKMPLFILAGGCSVLTMVAQHRGEAIASLSDVPFKFRLINAVVSYLRYLEKIGWPADLSILYPFTIAWPTWEIAAAVGVLVGVTALVVWGARPSRSQPPASRRRNAGITSAFSLQPSALSFGWFWFLGTLIPVIGLVQVGTQAMADRYAYIPSIGIFVAVCWGAYDLVTDLPFCRRRREESQFSSEAKAESETPNVVSYCLNGLLGIAVLTGCVLVSSRQIHFWENSGTLFAHAIEVTRDNYVARVNYSDYLADTQQWEAAQHQAEEAVRIAPNEAMTHNALGRVLLLEGKPDQAAAELRRAIALHYTPADAVQLAMALVQQGRTRDAIAEYRNILASTPDLPDALNNLAWILAAAARAEYRNGAEAVQLAERACAVTHDSQPLMVGTLAAAYAEAGRFEDAVKTAQKAHDLAVAQGKNGVASRNLELMEIYREHRAFHEAH